MHCVVTARRLKLHWAFLTKGIKICSSNCQVQLLLTHIRSLWEKFTIKVVTEIQTIEILSWPFEVNGNVSRSKLVVPGLIDGADANCMFRLRVARAKKKFVLSAQQARKTLAVWCVLCVYKLKKPQHDMHM